jgi:kinesin family protein C1
VQQEELFQEIRDMVGAVVDGKKVSIFAYGQTGAGKTYTMQGTQEEPGLIPRSVNLIFNTIDTYKKDGFLVEGTEVKISCIELHCETIKDLLDPEHTAT